MRDKTVLTAYNRLRSVRKQTAGHTLPLKSHYHVHTSSPVGAVQSETYLVHAVFNLFNINSNIIHLLKQTFHAQCRVRVLGWRLRLDIGHRARLLTIFFGQSKDIPGQYLKSESERLLQCSCQLIITWHCRDRVSSCNIYAVQQDRQCGSMSKFYLALMLARHVSDLIGPTLGAFFVQLVQNAPNVGPMRSETCRANKRCWIKLAH